MDHVLRCKCGTLQGTVRHPEQANHGVCYCKSCQAFAHILGDPSGILDDLGGSEVVATLQKNVAFTQGVDVLACLTLTEKGLLRWYAKCCNTPIGNTVRDFRVSFVGLVHNCLEYSSTPINASFGPVRMRAHTKWAKAKVDPMVWSTIASVSPLFVSLLGARINGGYKKTPFFDAATGKPVVTPRVLSAGEIEQAMRAV
jgi:Family of unknown function (DUF6151)